MANVRRDVEKGDNWIDLDLHQSNGVRTVKIQDVRKDRLVLENLARDPVVFFSSSCMYI